MKDSIFYTTRIKLTEVGGGSLYFNPNSIVLVGEGDGHTEVALSYTTSKEVLFVKVRETAEEIAALVEELHEKQKEYNKKLEEEAREQAAERFKKNQEMFGTSTD